jgi:hypothetical protein
MSYLKEQVEFNKPLKKTDNIINFIANKMLPRLAKKTYSVFLVLILLMQTGPAKAESETGIWNNLGACKKDGDCTLIDFVQLLINIFGFVLGIVGSLALLIFIYGGVLFLFSGGNSEQIEKGKKALAGAVIGLIIVFASYLIVYFTAGALGIQDPSALFNSEQLN